MDGQKLIATIDQLRLRIADRFPDSGLGLVCDQLAQVACQAQQRAEWIMRPVYWLRALIAVLIGLTLVILIATFAMRNWRLEVGNASDFIQMLEAGTNELIFIGAGIVFLVSLEIRWKRHRALDALHELRSIAHIIDMHQLTKDPERTLGSPLVTPHSPTTRMNRFELVRYLDYCSEMLSLTAKVGVLYVQRFHDPVALASANDLESLTVGLSRKIWQKIAIVYWQVGEANSTRSARI